MSDIDLKELFPDMRPVQKAPSIGSVNGFGTALYGARDKCNQTGAEVKTLWLTALYIPLIAFAAYRVVRAPDGGWYFLGRENVSVLAKAWSFSLVLLLVGGGAGFAWNKHYNSPDAVALRRLNAADQRLEKGQVVGAAQAYQSIARGSTVHSETATSKLESMHQTPQVAAAPLTDVSQVYGIQLGSRPNTIEDPVSQSIYQSGEDLIRERGLEDVDGAIKLINVVEPLANEKASFADITIPIFDAKLKSSPDEIATLGRLAQAYEQKGDLERCQSLLEPRLESLGISEGARILGQIYAMQGDADKAYPLLEPYCEERLQRLGSTEANYSRVYQSKREQAFQALDRGMAPQSFYQQYDLADEASQIAMVERYLEQQLEKDAQLNSARDAFIAEADVVPVALDLGMVMLRRAQTMTDPADRQEQLKSAETTFQSVRSVAGQTDDYRMYMGQVNYWLGKYDAGRQLFDELLESNQRSPQILLSVASMIRSVGRSEEARSLMEEAYESATDTSLRFTAAASRAALSTGTDDQITWLERSNPEDDRIKAGLTAAKGNVAIQSGDADAARQFYRDSIAAYNRMQSNPSTLNNSGLVCFRLYGLTGDQAYFDEGLSRLEKAIELLPTESTIRKNTAELLLSAVFNDAIKESIGEVKWNIIEATPSQRFISLAYNNETEKERVSAFVKDHRGMNRAIGLLENVMLLAPKDPGNYAILAYLYDLTHDVDALSNVLEKLKLASPESDYSSMRDILEGGEAFESMKSALARSVQSAWRSLENSAQDTVTYQAAAMQLAGLMVGYGGFERVERVDEALEHVLSIHEKTPSSAIRQAAIHLHLLRAHQQLAESNEGYGLLARRIGKVVSTSHLIAMAISDFADLRDAVTDHPDVRSAMDLLVESSKAFPRDISVWEWALFRHLDLDYAQSSVDIDNVNAADRMNYEINSRTASSPFVDAINGYWMAIAQGDQVNASGAFDQLAEQGFQMPIKNYGRVSAADLAAE